MHKIYKTLAGVSILFSLYLQNVMADDSRKTLPAVTTSPSIWMARGADGERNVLKKKVDGLESELNRTLQMQQQLALQLQEALKELNAIGYGMPDSNLRLDLVYNPSGAFLPGNQTSLEKDFKKSLLEDFNIQFHNLFAITNLPISRFLDYLIASDNYEDYMYSLVEAYNPTAVKNVMCTNTLSVSWDGFLYDCDFNQMLELPVNSKIKHISDYNEELLINRDIVISQHCYGCTAGAGSSCQGSVA